jgi:hypothetical protein
MSKTDPIYACAIGRNFGKFKLLPKAQVGLFQYQAAEKRNPGQAADASGPRRKQR